MAHSYLMTADHFEQKKNMQAGAYTAGILVMLALFLFLVSWQLPKIANPDPPLEMQGIEVNIGLDETGLGTDQPLLPGEPAPEASTEQAQATAANEGDDAIDDPESNVSVTRNETKTVTKNTTEATKVAAATKPVTNPTPAPAKPKAVFNGKSAPGGTGTGGNGADSYYKGSNQGIAGGRGDQGAPGGNPNSDSYTGNGRGNGGIRIQSGLGGRRIASVPNFQDDFNENAKVAVDVTVDVSGKVINASINPRGTTTTNRNIRDIAIRKARQLKFNSGAEDQNGTLIFDFKVNG